MLGFLLVVVLGQAPVPERPAADAGVATPPVKVLEKEPVVESDMDEDLWIHFFWGHPRQGAIGRRMEPGEMVTIDDKSGVLARLDRLGPVLVRVRVWCGRNESYDPVIDQELSLPEEEITTDCKGLGGLCTGTVDVSIRRAD